MAAFTSCRLEFRECLPVLPFWESSLASISMLERPPLLGTGLLTGEGAWLEGCEEVLPAVFDLTTARARRS